MHTKKYLPMLNGRCLALSILLQSVSCTYILLFWEESRCTLHLLSCPSCRLQILGCVALGKQANTSFPPPSCTLACFAQLPLAKTINTVPSSLVDRLVETEKCQNKALFTWGKGLSTFAQTEGVIFSSHHTQKSFSSVFSEFWETWIYQKWCF